VKYSNYKIDAIRKYLKSHKYLLKNIIIFSIFFFIFALIYIIFFLLTSNVDVESLYKNSLNYAAVLLSIDESFINIVNYLNSTIIRTYIIINIYEGLLLIIWAIISLIAAYITLISINVLFIVIQNDKSTSDLFISYPVKTELEKKKNNFLYIVMLILVFLDIFIYLLFNKRVSSLNNIISYQFNCLYIFIPILYILEWIISKSKKFNPDCNIVNSELKTIAIKKRIINLLFLLVFLSVCYNILFPLLISFLDNAQKRIINSTNLYETYNETKNLFFKLNKLDIFNNLYDDFDLLIKKLSFHSGLIYNTGSNFDFSVILKKFYITGGIISLFEGLGVLVLAKEDKSTFNNYKKILIKDVLYSTLLSISLNIFILVLFREGKLSEILDYRNIYQISIFFLFSLLRMPNSG
jgi:hypothetical protein